MNTCPHCHFPLTPARALVNAETVVDIYDVWIGRQQGKYFSAVTERIPIITIQTKEAVPPSRLLTESKTERP